MAQPKSRFFGYVMFKNGSLNSEKIFQKVVVRIFNVVLISARIPL
jgi:hypothetical protein